MLSVPSTPAGVTVSLAGVVPLAPAGVVVSLDEAVSLLALGATTEVVLDEAVFH